MQHMQCTPVPSFITIGRGATLEIGVLLFPIQLLIEQDLFNPLQARTCKVDAWREVESAFTTTIPALANAVL